MKNILFISATLFVSHTFAQTFIPNDTIIGDTLGFYNNIEFSPDGQFMAWQEPNPQSGYYKTYTCQMDLNTGDMIPWHGRGYFAGYNKNSVCYPGKDSIGNFFVYLDTIGKPVVVRPLTSVTGTSQTIAMTPDPNRVPFYPSWNPSSGTIRYFFLLKDINNIFQMHYVYFANPSITVQVTSNYDIQINNATTPIQYPEQTLYQGIVPFTASYYAGPRWFYGDNRLTYGRFNSLLDNRIQLWEMDFNSSSNPTPVQVTNDNYVHCDDFPFTFNGIRYTAGGINLENKIAVHKWNGSQYQTQFTKTLTGSNLSFPLAATSLEPFTFNGKCYSAVFMFDTICPQQGPFGCIGNSPAEIWLQSLMDANGNTDTTLSVILNLNTQMVRADPEYLIGANKVWIYYYGKNLSESRMKLHRCETPLPLNTLGIQNYYNESKITIYPNPSNTAINVDCKNGFKIYNSTGLLVRQNSQETTLINIADLPTGLYILKTENKIGRFIKQ